MIPLGTHDAFNAAADAFGCTAEQAKGRSQSRPYLNPRHAAWLIAREELGLTFPQIARHTSHDHTTVIGGCRRARGLLTTDGDFSRAYSRAKALVYRKTPKPVFKTTRKVTT